MKTRSGKVIKRSRSRSPQRSRSVHSRKSASPKYSVGNLYKSPARKSKRRSPSKRTCLDGYKRYRQYLKKNEGAKKNRSGKKMKIHKGTKGGRYHVRSCKK